MKRILAILGRELRALFESPIAYVTIVLFVLSLSGLFFFVGYPIGKVPLPSLWEGGQASVIVLFTWLPLLLAFLVPALTMGTWAEERGTGTEELLLTYPLRTREVVIGKFLAVWSFAALLIALTVLPVAWTVDSLGDLDWGTVWVGTAGAILLAAGYAAVSLPFSAATGEQLVAFLLGAITLALLWAARFTVDLFPAAFAGALEYAAPSSHFVESAARGVFDLRDVVYFGLLVVFGLNLNVLLVEKRRWA